MKFRELGRTGEKVSLIGLGTMTWGEQNTERDAHEQLDLAVGAGVNLIDAAEMYPVPPRKETQGDTERCLGSWLKATGKRDEVLIASKVSGPAAWLEYVRGGPRLNRKHMAQAVEDSLTRLQTDRIDLYQLHWPERQTNYFGKLAFEAPEPKSESDAIPLAETLAALGDLVQAGKIRYVGLSNETPWGLMHAVGLADASGCPRIVSVQNPYNLLNRSFEAGCAEISFREQVGLLAYSPLAFGVLSGKYLGGARPTGARLTLFERFQRYNSDRAEAATSAYAEIAARHGLDLAQMSLAWVNSRSFLTSNLIGATSLEQLQSNLASVDLQLDQDLLAEIDEVNDVYTYPCP